MSLKKDIWDSQAFSNTSLVGQRLMGETKWEKGVETASSDFLRFSAAPNHLPCRSRTKSAKICENLRQAAVSPFSLSHLVLPDLEL